MTEHADIEALSAFADGEAPEWAAHVAACAACREQVRALQAVRGAVGAPVLPLAPERRDAVIAAALAALPGRDIPASATPAVRRQPRTPARWLVPAASIAAVLLAVVGATAVLTGRGRGGDGRTTVAGPALQSPESASSRADAASGSAVPPSGDLGDIPDAATLIVRAQPALATLPPVAAGDTKAGASATSGQSAVATPGRTLAPASPSATPGTRACELQARAADPSVRELVYFTTARTNGVPAFVLGFATGTGPGRVSLFVLEQRGCAVLLRAAT